MAANTIFHDTFAHGTAGDNLDGTTPDIEGTSWTDVFNNSVTFVELVRAGNDVVRSAGDSAGDIIVFGLSPTPDSGDDIDIYITMKLVALDADEGVHFNYKAIGGDGENFWGLTITGDATARAFLWKMVNNSPTTVGTSTSTPVDGDVFRIEVRGTDSHEVFINDVSEINVTDSTHSTGNGGAVFWGALQSGWHVSSDSEIDAYQVDVITADPGGPKGPLGHPFRGPFGGPI